MREPRDRRVLHHTRFLLWRWRDAVRDRIFGRTHRTQVFDRIYRENLWGEEESMSGRGSSLEATVAIRGALSGLFARRGIASLLDAPCGDFAWMRHVVQCLKEYQGVDIVPDLIRRNQLAYGSQTVRFICLDLTVDTLPRCDLVLCRDCFIHLPTRAIRQAMGNFIASGATWLLAGNQPGALYHDIPLGSFRPVDLTAPPFSWPEPIERLADNDGELCLWRLQDLR